MDWIYLSPHFDDVALSCGGPAWEQARAGQRVTVWTLCAGPQPEGPLSPFAQSLHARWGTGRTAATQRQAEDIASCQQLRAGWLHFDVPDCIYRRGPDGMFLYDSEESLSGRLHPGEAALIERLSQEMAARLPEAAQVVCPLGLGNHVDHQLTRAAAERLPRPLWYYADYPYVLQEAERLEQMQQAGWKTQVMTVSAAGLAAWQAAVAAHASQISTFWPSLEAMQAAIEAYCQQTGGVRRWKKAKKGI
jgi:LmbE family N-acetylglucosaminyl deacetylase